MGKFPRLITQLNYTDFVSDVELQVFYASSIADALVQVAGFVRLCRL
jgi:hypothetical protein